MSSCKIVIFAFRWTMLEIGIFIGMTLMASSQHHGRCLCSDLSAMTNQVFLMAVFRDGSLKDVQLSLGPWWRYRKLRTKRLPSRQRTSEVSLPGLSSKPRGSVLTRLRTDGR